MGFDWSDERVAELKDLHRKGYSASQIAVALGGGLTRNAVCGKLDRLKISALPKRQKATLALPATTPRLPRTPSRAASHSAKTLPVALVPSPTAEPLNRAITLMDLTETTCRWPAGDPKAADFSYCGAHKNGTEAGPYCIHHSRMAYQPASAYRAENKRAMNRALMG